MAGKLVLDLQMRSSGPDPTTLGCGLGRDPARMEFALGVQPVTDEGDIAPCVSVQAKTIIIATSAKRTLPRAGATPPGVPEPRLENPEPVVDAQPPSSSFCDTHLLVGGPPSTGRVKYNADLES